MFKKVFLIIILLQFKTVHAQFSFSGEVNEEFKESIVYLNLVDNYDKSTLFLTENILLETTVDSLNTFNFSGNFLNNSNRLYKIFIDNCNENVTNYNHIHELCDKSKSILFIANNRDSIQFPLNEFTQVFCSIQYTNKSNIAISKIDSLQEFIYYDFHKLKNEKQRNIIYKKNLKELQNFSKTYSDPLVELYAHYLYANDKSLSKSFYQSDLKKSKYYLDLLTRLETEHSNTNYYNHFKNELEKEGYPFLERSAKTTNYSTYIVLVLLLLSIFTNVFLWRKLNKQKSKVIAYTDVLTSQEQKVFELMYKKMTNKEIASTLFVSLSTVKTHINNIYSKLSISSRSEIDKFF